VNVTAEAAYYRIDEAMQVAKEFQARTGRKPARIVWDKHGQPVALATEREVTDWQRQRARA